jgi:hypothetical protein
VEHAGLFRGFNKDKIRYSLPELVDPDSAFQVNPDPIRIQGFDEQKGRKKYS